jgi:hypothetical protein
LAQRCYGIGGLPQCGTGRFTSLTGARQRVIDIDPCSAAERRNGRKALAT